MIELTVLVAVLASIVTLVARPGRALGVIVASMLLWPEYIRFPIGLCQMSAPRLAATFLVLRLSPSARKSGFRWRAVDTIVILGWIWTVIANDLAHADQPTMVYQIGRGLDTVLPYFAARLALSSREDFRDFCAPVVLTAVAISILGAIESLTFRCVYQPFLDMTEDIWEKEPEFRWDMLRAQASTLHAIYFGTAMVILAGMLWSVRGVAKSAKLPLLGMVFAIVGVMASLSSGPQSALFLLLVCNGLYFRPSLVKKALWGMLGLSVLTEIVSNRHFFYVLTDLVALGSPNGWYRAKLFDVAIQQVHEYWSVGVGSRWIGHWGALIDGRNHVDIVNHFIVIAIAGGLLAVGLYILSHVLAIRDAVRAWRTARDPAARKLVFGLVATLIALDAASMSVGLYGPPLILSHFLLAMNVDLDRKIGAPAPARVQSQRRGLLRPRAAQPGPA